MGISNTTQGTAVSDEKVLRSLRKALVYPLGHTVAGYKITGHLSVGQGMANVYRAEKTDLGITTTWVLKQIIDPNVFLGRVSKRAFTKAQREQEALKTEASIMLYLKDMPHIPRIVSRVEDKSYQSQLLIMDYISGKTMNEYLYDEEGKPTPVPLDLAVSWVREVASIFARLHNQEKPVVYRDCKPSNIMISDSGEVHIIDFGTAELISEPGTKPKRGMGTDGYAAPEQKSRNNPLDIRSDIYALGVTLYQLVTGFAPKTTMRINGEERLIQDDSAPFTVAKLGLGDKVPLGINDIIIKATQPNPADRYQSMEMFLVDLRNYKKKEHGYRKEQRRKVQGVYSVLVAGVICIAGATGAWWAGNMATASNYTASLAVAQQSGRVADYYQAIEIKPQETDAYFGLIESLKSDGSFTQDEESQLLSQMNPNLLKLKEKDKYPELAYELGKLYWYYYEGDGVSQSSKWFRDAEDGSYNPEGLSTVYYSISNFSKGIASAVKDGTDGGMYKEYWDNLNSALTKEHGSLTKLHMYSSIVSAVDSYAYKLNQDGVPQEDIEKILDDIEVYIKSNNPKGDNEEAYYQAIKEKLPGLKSKVTEAYSKSEYLSSDGGSK